MEFRIKKCVSWKQTLQILEVPALDTIKPEASFATSNQFHHHLATCKSS